MTNYKADDSGGHVLLKRLECLSVSIDNATLCNGLQG